MIGVFQLKGFLLINYERPAELNLLEGFKCTNYAVNTLKAMLIT